MQTAFKDWIARRIQDFGFVDGSDFCSFLSESAGGRPSREYALTLDMAKELAIVERNAKVSGEHMASGEGSTVTVPPLVSSHEQPSFCRMESSAGCVTV